MTPYWTENLSHSPARKGRATAGSTTRSPAGTLGSGSPAVSTELTRDPPPPGAAPARGSRARQARPAARLIRARDRAGRRARPPLECVLSFITGRIFARPVPRPENPHRGDYVVQPIPCQTSACAVGSTP